MKTIYLKQFFKSSLMILMVCFGVAGLAQQSITALETEQEQNFNSMGSSATAALPTGFKASSTGAWTGGTTNTSTTQAAGTSGTGALTASSTYGVYNFASGITASSTDRALGFITTSNASSFSPWSIVYAFTNNTGSTVTSLEIEFDYEKYRAGTRAWDWTFFHGSNGSSIDTSVEDGNQSYAADAANAVVNPPTSISKSFIISDISIAPGTTYYLRWTSTGLGGKTNAQGIGIDNFKITLKAGDEPALSVSTEEITGLNYGFGNGPSAAQSFVLSGENLDGTDLELLVDSEFQISENQNSGYSDSITLTDYDGAEKTIWVRLAAGQSVESYTGNILISGGGAEEDAMIEVSGAVLAVPVVQEDIFFGTVGVSFSEQITASESPTGYTLVGVLPNGLSLNETTGVISGTPTVAGEEFNFQITATNLAGTSAVADFIIEIEKGTQTVEGFNDANVNVNAETYELPAQTNAGLTLTYESSNESVATVAGNIVTIIALGETTVTATQTGDTNWNEFEGTITLTVSESYDGTGLFIKITSEDDLTDGYYVITNETDAFLMTSGRSGTDAAGYFVSASSSADSGMIENPSVNNVWKIETNGDGKTIYNEVTEKYVGWQSGNAASIEDAPADTNRWTFTYENDKFTVNNVATTARQLSYNSGSPRFAAYGNANQQELQLFKYTNATIWTTDNEWVNGTPAIDKNVLVLGDLEVSEAISAKTITIKEEGSITVQNGASVTVDGTIENNGTFVLESGANLIQTPEFTGANTGAITVKRNTSIKHLDYTIWSSPLVGQGLQAFSPLTLANRIRVYDGVANNWVATTGNFDSGKGYMFRAPNANDGSYAGTYNWTGTFNGVPQNGNVTNNFTAGVFQSFGNPYASNISRTTFHSANPNVGTLYFWTNTYPYANGEYEGINWTTINRDGDTVPAHIEGEQGNGNQISNGIISVGQGFIAETNGVITQAIYNNDMRVSNSANFFRTMSQEKHGLRLNLSTQNKYVNQILVNYADGASNGEDFGIDAKVFGYAGTALYTLIENNENNFVIQARSLPFNDTDVVSLGFRATVAGTFTVSLANFDGLFEQGQDIFIKDNLTQTQHNLKDGSYTFVSDAGTFNGRFQIVYREVLNVSVPDLNNNWIVYSQNGLFQIATEGFEMKEVIVYDMLGRVVYQNVAEGNNHSISNLLTNGVMIVKVITTENQTLTKKTAK